MHQNNSTRYITICLLYCTERWALLSKQTGAVGAGVVGWGSRGHISANRLVHVLPHQPPASWDESPCIIANDDGPIFATGCLPAWLPAPPIATRSRPTRKVALLLDATVRNVNSDGRSEGALAIRVTTGTNKSDDGQK